MSPGQRPSNDIHFVRFVSSFFACVKTKQNVDKLVFCYDFDWFILFSRDQRQSMLKIFCFKRLKRVPWVLFQAIVLGSS